MPVVSTKPLKAGGYWLSNWQDEGLRAEPNSAELQVVTNGRWLLAESWVKESRPLEGASKRDGGAGTGYLEVGMRWGGPTFVPQKTDILLPRWARRVLGQARLPIRRSGLSWVPRRVEDGLAPPGCGGERATTPEASGGPGRAVVTWSWAPSIS